MITAGRRRALLVMAGMLTAACIPRGPSGLQPGQTFPELALTDLEGRPQQYSQKPGRATLVNLWATWCEPCRREMPALERLAATYGEHGLDLLALSIDDDANLVKEFLLRYRLRLPVLLDLQQVATKHILTGTVLPRSYLVARDGRLLRILNGYRDWNSAESQAIISRLIGRG